MDPEIAPIFPKVAAKIWARKQGDWERELKRLCARLEEKKGLKKKLLQNLRFKEGLDYSAELGILNRSERALTTIARIASISNMW